MLDTLPDDLTQELRNSDTKIRENRLVKLLTIAGRSVTLDELLVSLYRKFDVIEKRRIIQAALYRLKNKGLIEVTERGKYKIK